MDSDEEDIEIVSERVDQTLEMVDRVLVEWLEHQVKSCTCLAYNLNLAKMARCHHRTLDRIERRLADWQYSMYRFENVSVILVQKSGFPDVTNESWRSEIMVEKMEGVL